MGKTSYRLCLVKEVVQMKKELIVSAIVAATGTICAVIAHRKKSRRR